MASADEDLLKGIASNDFWIERWAEGKATWHSNEHDTYLDKHNGTLFEGKLKTVFVPLCGKTPDMLWMYKNGHSVVGVEIAEQAVKEFFTDNDMQFDVEPIDGAGNLYKSKDGRIKLYAVNVFDMNRERCGQFDIIYDSGAFTAINVADRERYRDLLKTLVKSDGHYFVFTCEYDTSVHPGPPHSITSAEFDSLFGDSFIIQLLEQSNFHEFMKTLPDESLSDPIAAAIMKSKYMLDRRYKLTLK